MKAKDCKWYYVCNAPLCPKDQKSLEHGIWYTDQEVCKLKGYHFVTMQKRIQRATQCKDVGYFVHEMLDRKYKVTKDIHGLDPESTAKDEIKKWLSQHKDIKPLTTEKKKEIMDNVIALKNLKQANNRCFNA